MVWPPFHGSALLFPESSGVGQAGLELGELDLLLVLLGLALGLHVVQHLKDLLFVAFFVCCSYYVLCYVYCMCINYCYVIFPAADKLAHLPTKTMTFTKRTLNFTLWRDIVVFVLRGLFSENIVGSAHGRGVR